MGWNDMLVSQERNGRASSREPRLRARRGGVTPRGRPATIGGRVDLIAHAWRRDDHLALIAADISAQGAQRLVQIGALPPGDAFDLRDQLSDRVFRWTREALKTGLYVHLGAGDAHVFLVEPASFVPSVAV